jgi:hypothetical protein
MPVVAQALYAESQPVFALVFAMAWCALVAGCGFGFYRIALKSDRMAGLAIVLALATTALLFRVPSNFLQPEFTAEDGCVFFVQQRDFGWHAFFITDAGYYHTLIRIVAAMASAAPTLFVPVFYNLSWLAVYSAVVAYILFQYPDKKLAPLIALTTAFVSHTCEVFMTVTNVIWIVGLGLTALVLLPVPRLEKWPRYLFGGVLLVFSLSGPFGIVLTPFYFLRWLVDRKNFPLVYVIAVLLGAVGQLSVIHSLHNGDNAGIPLDSATLHLGLKIAILRVPWSLMAGYQPPPYFWKVGGLAVLVLAGFIAREIVANWRKHLFPLACLLLCAVYVALDVLRVSMPQALMFIHDGDRYFYIPKILFVWALLHFASTALHRFPFYVALLFCVLGSLVQFTSTSVIADNHWPHYAVLIDQGQQVTVPTNPPGWSALVNSHPASPPSP